MLLNHYVCRLNKALYGLKQAYQAWYDELRNTLLHWGFSHTKSDHSLFALHTEMHVILILFYVDDILVIGDSYKLVSDFIKELDAKFSLKDLGELH